MTYVLDTKNPSQCLLIESSKASNYLSNTITTAFQYDVESITCDSDESLILSVSNIIIPYSFYGINITKNKIDVLEFKDKDDEKEINNINAVIKPGNYNALQLCGMLESILNERTTYFIHYIITYDKIYNKFSIAIDSMTNPNCKVIFQFDSGANAIQGIGRTMGFIQDKEIKIGDIINSDGCINLNDSYLYLKSDIIKNAYAVPDSSDNVIAIIPVNVPINSTIFYSPNPNPSFLIKGRNIEQFNVSLTDKYNNIIDLNGLHWSFVIHINYVSNDNINLPYSKNARDEADNLAYRWNNLNSIPEDLDPNDNGPSLEDMMQLYKAYLIRNRNRKKRNLMIRNRNKK